MLHHWLPSAAFWRALPTVLPQLQQLELGGIAPLDRVPVGVAMSMACTELQRAGHPFELVFRHPSQPEIGLHEVVGLLQALQPLVNVRIVP